MKAKACRDAVYGFMLEAYETSDDGDGHHEDRACHCCDGGAEAERRQGDGVIGQAMDWGDEASALANRLADEPHVRLGEVLMGLHIVSDEPIASHHLDARARTALRRLECATWGALAEKTPGQISSVPGSGQLTLARILAAAATRHCEVTTPRARLPDDSAGNPATRTGQDTAAEEGIVPLINLLARVATWAVRERGATSLADLIQLSASLGSVPKEIGAEFQRLSSRDLTVFFGTMPPELPPTLPRQLFEEAGSGSQIFIRRKLAGASRPTLAEIADEVGLTRERIRQLEFKASDTIRALLDTPKFAPIRWRASDLADVLGAAVPAGSELLADATDWATRGLEDSDAYSNADLMLWIAGPYERDGDWLVRSDSSLDELVGMIQDQFKGLLVIQESDVQPVLEELGLANALLGAVAALMCSWRPIAEGVWIQWSGSVGDKAEVVLRLVGESSSTETINRLIGEGHAVSTLRNALSSDRRFVRIDKAGRYALAEWGLEEYSGIANEMAERIERAGGYVELNEVIREFVDEFGVSENSVRMYAAAPAFVLEEGRVRLRRKSEPYETDARIHRVNGLFVRPSGEVIYHDVIDRDVLRGSGRSLPDPAAVALGISPGMRMTFAYTDGDEVVVSWPWTATAGPSLGSIRRVAESFGLKEGDRFRLVSDADHRTCWAEPADSTSVYGLTGVHVEAGNELQMLAAAMQVEPNAVRAHLRTRGEDDLLAFLPEYDSSDALGEAIAKFGSLLDN